MRDTPDSRLVCAGCGTEARGPYAFRCPRAGGDDVDHVLSRVLDVDWLRFPAISTRNFCMSHAPVGQRSAQSPQCRQTSSSLTITRPVLSAPDTVSAWSARRAGA